MTCVRPCTSCPSFRACTASTPRHPAPRSFVCVVCISSMPIGAHAYRSSLGPIQLASRPVPFLLAAELLGCPLTKAGQQMVTHIRPAISRPSSGYVLSLQPAPRLVSKSFRGVTHTCAIWLSSRLMLLGSCSTCAGPMRMPGNEIRCRA